jgi:hypothetical protein
MRLTRDSGERIKVEWGIGGLKMKWLILKSTFTMRRRTFAVVFEACCKMTNFIHRKRCRMTMVDSGNATGGAWDSDAEDEAKSSCLYSLLVLFMGLFYLQLVLRHQFLGIGAELFLINETDLLLHLENLYLALESLRGLLFGRSDVLFLTVTRLMSAS